MLLRYSSKEDRVKNLGLFRVAGGAGTVFSPLLGAGMYAAGGFVATFLSLGVGALIL